jgi:hypothetical protein
MPVCVRLLVLEPCWLHLEMLRWLSKAHPGQASSEVICPPSVSADAVEGIEVPRVGWLP